MNQERKVDLRIQKTRHAIKSEFKQMVCEMDANKITVKELTERAHIHRKTFYLHYTSIEALFEDMLQEIANKYYEEIDQISANMPMEEINQVFFSFLSKQDAFSERLICTESYRDFSYKLFATTLRHNRARYNPYSHLPIEEQNIVNTFTCESSLDMYRRWVADGKKIPIERMIELSGTLLCHGVDAILNSK